VRVCAYHTNVSFEKLPCKRLVNSVNELAHVAWAALSLTFINTLYIYICTHTQTYIIYIYTHTHINIFTNTYNCTHIYIHSHTHTPLLSQVCTL